MPRRALIMLFFAALILVTPAPIQAWGLEDHWLGRALTPSTLHVVKAEPAADFDADGRPETLTLTGERAAIWSGDRIRWQSPPAWQVKQAQVTDLNRDGTPEVTLLVWRPFKPWPVDAWLPNGGRINSFHDSNGNSCHLILIGWKQGSFRELWAGSALAEPVDRFVAADFAGDGRQYLVTLTGNYDDPPSAPSRLLKVWEWNGFGFAVVHELADSSSLIVLVQAENGRVLILTN